MDLDDEVDLVVVTNNNFLPVGRQTRKSAMEQILHWFVTRDAAAKGDSEAQRFLESGTLAGAHLDMKDNKKPYYDHWAVAWNAIQGMYIREVPPSSPSLAEIQASLAESQVKLVGVLRKAIESRGFFGRLFGK